MILVVMAGYTFLGLDILDMGIDHKRRIKKLLLGKQLGSCSYFCLYKLTVQKLFYVF